jgi:hypothetical protein
MSPISNSLKHSKGWKHFVHCKVQISALLVRVSVRPLAKACLFITYCCRIWWSVTWSRSFRPANIHILHFKLYVRINRVSHLRLGKSCHPLLQNLPTEISQTSLTYTICVTLTAISGFYLRNRHAYRSRKTDCSCSVTAYTPHPHFLVEPLLPPTGGVVLS